MKEISMKQYCEEQERVFLLKQCNLAENNTIELSHISYASHKTIWWQCEKGHKWQSAVCDRLIKDTGCPYCTNKKVLAGFNDLATSNPEIVPEWHPQKNGALTPEQVISGSDRIVWWQCALGHEWRASIENRVKKKQCCPYCSGRKAWPGFNDLATLHPKLMKEWHPTLNTDIDPRHIRPASAKRVWWQCSEGHVWNAYVFNRTSKAKSGCPFCAGNRKSDNRGE
jgi:hypothetical protein